MGGKDIAVEKGSNRSPCRVVIVDNDESSRRGFAQMMAQSPDIAVVNDVDHEVALSWTTEWDEVDVALVDAADPRRESVDKFPGVQVVSQLRARRRSEETVVVVLTGHFFNHGLRRRMREAGADFFYHRIDGIKPEELIGVVLHPDDHRRTDQLVINLPDDLGVTDSTKVNEVVDRLVSSDVGNALDPERRKKTDVHGERSRWWMKVRALAGGPGGLQSVKGDGRPAMDRDLPSVPQLRKFWRTMTEPRPPEER